MKINRNPKRKPQAVQVSRLGKGVVYRLVAQCSGSGIDEDKIYIRNEDQMVQQPIAGTHMMRSTGAVIKSSTCLNDGRLIVFGRGHEENMAYVLDVELVVKGEQI